MKTCERLYFIPVLVFNVPFFVLYYTLEPYLGRVIGLLRIVSKHIRIYTSAHVDLPK